MKDSENWTHGSSICCITTLRWPNSKEVSVENLGLSNTSVNEDLRMKDFRILETTVPPLLFICIFTFVLRNFRRNYIIIQAYDFIFVFFLGIWFCCYDKHNRNLNSACMSEWVNSIESDIPTSLAGYHLALTVEYMLFLLSWVAFYKRTCSKVVNIFSFME